MDSVKSSLRVLLGASLIVLAVPGCSTGSDPVINTPDSAELVTSTVASGFDTIWDLVWAPDGTIWLTERSGTISRVDPASGTVTRLGEIDVAENGEGGLLGLALHPDFPSQPWVYVAHTVAAPGDTRNRVVRLRFNGTNLGSPEILLDSIPASSVHNGSRLAVGPDRLLYVSFGDAASAPLAQDRNSLAGKILRMTLDGAPAPGNPFGSFVYSYGHRNPQGLVFAPSGVLYETEHGPNDNDEVNRIESGRNYGWPNVRGMCDGDAGASEVAFCQANSVVEPLRTWTPTIAPSGLAFYSADRISGWRGSLLFTTLKGSALYRLTLAADGRSVTGSETFFQDAFGRLRDVLVAPDGLVYLATSNRDGRGSAGANDDRIIRISPK